MSNNTLIDQGWEHLDGTPVKARLIDGYEEAPDIAEGLLVVTEMMDLSGEEHLGSTYTVDGWSVMSESIQTTVIS